MFTIGALMIRFRCLTVLLFAIARELRGCQYVSSVITPGQLTAVKDQVLSAAHDPPCHSGSW
jgi:hypothetical protein